jgi:signal transduction histidine kinase
MMVPDIPLNEHERLRSLRRHNILDTMDEQEFNDIASIAAAICGTPISAISFVDEERQWFKAAEGLTVKETSRDVSFCAHAINDPKNTMVVHDARSDARFQNNPLVIGDPSVVFYAGTPIIDEYGCALGTLCVIDVQPRNLSDSQLNLLRALTRRVEESLQIRLRKQQAESDRNYLFQALNVASPFYLILDQNSILRGFGEKVRKIYPLLAEGSAFGDFFDWSNQVDILAISNQETELQKLVFFVSKDGKQKYKCSIRSYGEGSVILYSVPVINAEYPIANYNLTIKDFPQHDYIAEYIFLQQAATRGLEDSKRLNNLLTQRNDELRISQSALIKSNAVLERRVEDRTKKIRDLARYPEENPYPIIELDYQQEVVTYLNPAAILVLGGHEGSSFDAVCETLQISSSDFLCRTAEEKELELNEKIYQLNIYFADTEPRARCYLYDITEIRQREKEVRRREEILGTIRLLPNDIPLQEKIKVITKAIGREIGADRCSVWLLDVDDQVIRTSSVYEFQDDYYSPGISLDKRTYPAYFEGLLSGEIIFAANATTHPYTFAFTDGYLNPLGICSTLYIPVVLSGEVIGVLCNEYRTPISVCDSSVVNFVKSAADIVALFHESEKLNDALFALRIKNESLEQAYEKIIGMQEDIIAQEKMASLGVLIAGIAHEINTPLGAIKASNESILEGIASQFNLSEELLNSDSLACIFNLANTYIPQSKPLTTREERAYSQAINRDLATRHPNLLNTMFIAKRIVELGHTAYSDIFEVFITHPKYDQIFAAASKMVNTRRSVENIQVSVEKAARVVKSLNRFAHANVEGEHTYFNLKESLDTVITILWNRIKTGSQVQVKVNESSRIFGNQDELNQVWTNIINNAIQACNYTAQIEIWDAEIDGYHHIYMRNNGPRIPDEIRSRIFEPFFSTKKVGEGTGLGLHIVKKIIDKHNGEISCESDDTYTTFIVKIPIKL